MGLLFWAAGLVCCYLSCQKPELGQGWMEPEFEAVFVVHRPSETAPRGHLTTKSSVWRRGGYELAYRSGSSSPQSYSLLAAPESFIVSFSPQSSLALRLASDPATKIYQPGTEQERGFALVQIQDPSELEKLAALAHDDSAGLGCGNIEKINALPLATESIYHRHPVYDEHLALPAVRALLPQVQAAEIKASVQRLSSLQTRGHSSEQGLETPALIQELAAKHPLAGLEIERLRPNSYLTAQENVVMRLPGTEDPETLVIVGAHMDTILGRDPSGAAPGADDDASGIAVLLEVLRILAANSLTFKRTIELHAYAAEEVGLIGSQSLALAYREEKRQVAAMLQLDMVSYAAEPGDQTLYLISTDTSPLLRRSLKNLLHTYLGGDYEELALSAGTSDHRSWTNQGFPAVFPFEHPLNYNHRIHTSGDTLAYAQEFGLARRFAQTVLAFLGHHAGLDAATDDDLAASNPLRHDIALALSQTSPTSWSIGAATPATMTKLDFCQVTSSNHYRCHDQLWPLTSQGQKNGKNFFEFSPSTSSFALKEGSSLAFFAYDHEDKLVGRRIVTLKPH